MPRSVLAQQDRVAKPRRRKWLRWLKRLALVAGGLGGAALIAGATYQWAGMRADARRFPQEGQWVDAGGFRLNLNCTGRATEGIPTVILESGAGVPGVGWKLVQPHIEKFARVCSYDRAGYGWSDLPVDFRRTSSEVAKELHTALQNAGVQPPYVLVGHSLGGFNIRAYNGLYSEEVAGAIFVDSSHEDQLQKMSPEMRSFFEKSIQSLRSQTRLVPFLIDFGVMRWMQQRERKQESIPLDLVDEVDYLQERAGFFKIMLAEMEAFDESAREVRNSGDFGDKPVVVLTAGKSQEIPGVPRTESEQFHQSWVTELQPQLARLSTRGKQIVVSNSDHMIPFEAPESIVDATRDVVASATRPGVKNGGGSAKRQ